MEKSEELAATLDEQGRAEWEAPRLKVAPVNTETLLGATVGGDGNSSS